MSHRFAEEMAEGLAAFGGYLRWEWREGFGHDMRAIGPKGWLMAAAFLALCYVGAVGWALTF